jgi:type I restriction enzyme R subunit
MANLRTQLQKHNKIAFIDKEFDRVLNILSKGSVFDYVSPVLVRD